MMLEAQGSRSVEAELSRRELARRCYCLRHATLTGRTQASHFTTYDHQKPRPVAALDLVPSHVSNLRLLLGGFIPF